MKPILRSLCTSLGVMLMLGTFAGCDLIEPLLHAEGQPNDTAEQLQTEQAQTEQTSNIADEVQTLPMDTKESRTEQPADTTLPEQTQSVPTDTEEISQPEENQTTDAAETTQNEETQPIEIVDLDDLSTMLTMLFADPEDNTVNLSAYPLMQMGGLSWVYIMDVRVEGEVIYIMNQAYVQGSAPAPVVAFDHYDFCPDYIAPGLMDQEIYDMDPEEVLKRMNDSEHWYTLEPASSQMQNLGTITVYRIDNAYYFVTYAAPGSAIRIHCAMIK